MEPLRQQHSAAMTQKTNQVVTVTRLISTGTSFATRKIKMTYLTMMYCFATVKLYLVAQESQVRPFRRAEATAMSRLQIKQIGVVL